MEQSDVITENDYPVSMLWAFKVPITFFLINIFCLILTGSTHPFLLFFFFAPLIIDPLRVKNFHYALEDKLMVINQGVISKQQRSMPYGVIQNVLLRQDIYDRIFGTASLQIENAAQAGGGKKTSWSDGAFGMRADKQRDQEGLGAYENRVSIPGLRKEDAEELREFILNKIKENPVEDSQSGL